MFALLSRLKLIEPFGMTSDRHRVVGNREEKLLGLLARRQIQIQDIWRGEHPYGSSIRSGQVEKPIAST